MAGKAINNPKVQTALAVAAWLVAFFPFFAFFGFLKINLVAWLASAPLDPASFWGNFWLVTAPGFLHGFAASFLAIFLALNVFKKADTSLAAGISGGGYLVLAFFVFSLGYAPPVNLAVFHVAGVIANPVGVLAGLGLFVYREYRVKTLAKKLAKKKG